MRKLHIQAAGGALAAALISASGFAQNSEEITVEASRVVARSVAGQPPGGAQIKDITLSYGVSYAGVDLNSTAAVAALEKSINDAAHKACKEIGRQYPMSTPNDAECAKAAAAKAMGRVHELVSAAATKPAK